MYQSDRLSICHPLCSYDHLDLKDFKPDQVNFVQFGKQNSYHHLNDFSKFGCDRKINTKVIKEHIL